MPIKQYKRLFMRQKGISMIEVLVALIILAIGLLATASMQMMSLQNSSNSEYRTQAVNLAMEMADRMQTNYSEVLKDAATTPYDSTTDRCVGPTCVSARLECCSRVPNDGIVSWIEFIEGSDALSPEPALPEGSAIICRDSNHELLNDLDSNNSGTIDNNDDPCVAAANVCDVAGTANNFSPYVIRVCWSESGGRRDIDGDGDIDAIDREANQILLPNGRVLHQYSITVQ